MPAPPRITVIAACLNERVNIEEWMRQLDWADSIVVVDSGSKDGSVELLQQRASRVRLVQSDRGPETLIHVLKNQALSSVNDGWVLDLDMDERVTPSAREEILAATRNAAIEVSAFLLPFRHYVFGRWLQHGGWLTRHIRLYRAGSLSYPEDRAHSTPTVAGEIGELQQPIIHFAHPTIHEFWVKMNRYTSHDAPLFSDLGKGGLRNRVLLPVSPFRWFWASLSVFWNRYVKGAGFRDGVPGLLIAVLMAAYNFVEQAKVWEYRQQLGAEETGESVEGA